MIRQLQAESWTTYANKEAYKSAQAGRENSRPSAELTQRAYTSSWDAIGGQADQIFEHAKKKINESTFAYTNDSAHAWVKEHSEHAAALAVKANAEHNREEDSDGEEVEERKHSSEEAKLVQKHLETGEAEARAAGKKRKAHSEEDEPEDSEAADEEGGEEEAVTPLSKKSKVPDDFASLRGGDESAAAQLALPRAIGAPQRPAVYFEESFLEECQNLPKRRSRKPSAEARTAAAAPTKQPQKRR